MILSQFFPSANSSKSNAPSADVSAKVTKVMQAQQTGAAKLNAALAGDNTTLSGLGKLLNALTTFQSSAQSLASATSPSSNTLAQDVTKLVNGYNALNAALKGLQQGDLQAEGSISRIQNQLARVLNSGASGSQGAAAITLGSIGITTQKNGDLSIDAAKLQNAINANPSSVDYLFHGGGSGIANKLVSQIQSMVGSSGTIPREVSTISKDLAALTLKKTNLAQALTNQANALVKLYTQQNGSSSSSGNPTLFDTLG